MSLYFVRRNDDPRGLIKIGHASDVNARLSSLRGAVPEGLELLATAPGGYLEEQAIHEALDAHRVAGEWFMPHPDTLELVSLAASGHLDTSPAIISARSDDRTIPHYTDLVGGVSAVVGAISCLNELVAREYRGKGDTVSAARDRVADAIKQPRSICKSLWHRWKTWTDVSGSLMSALFTATADAAEADGTLPDFLRHWTSTRLAEIHARLAADEMKPCYLRRFPERDNEEETT